MWGGRGCALPFYIACDAQPGHSQQISLCCHRPRPNPWVVAHNNRTPHAGATTTKGSPKVHDLRQDVSLTHPPRSIQHTCACADCCAPQHTIRPPRPAPSQVLSTSSVELVLCAPNGWGSRCRISLDQTVQILVDHAASADAHSRMSMARWEDSVSTQRRCNVDILSSHLAILTPRYLPALARILG